ncbi:tyrosine-type recombinase/integrase [Kocuria sp. CPCC 205300]|uniref:tyrosine-type recombinase/integrase n=1 Tax=Kocuria sabuli TaxID=3071448 RepID=UPI0036D81057
MEEIEGQGALSDRPVLHDLRQTHATCLLARDVPIHAVSARLGHESITTTVNTYGHLVDDADRLAADALDGT